MESCGCNKNNHKHHGCDHFITNNRDSSEIDGIDTIAGSDVKETSEPGFGEGRAYAAPDVKKAGHDALIRLLDRFRSPMGEYDVLVPGNGGIYSASLAHMLREQYGMNPLTVTWAPNLPTAIGRENLQGLLDSGLDNTYVSPNWQVHRKLTQLSFSRLAHPMLPSILGQRAITGKTALYHNIGLVFFAHPPDHSGNGRKNDYHPDMGNGSTRIEDVYPGELANRYGITRGDLSFYHSPDPKEMFNAGMEIHYLSDFLTLSTRQTMAYAMEHTGFKPAPQREEGTYTRCHEIDDKMTSLHYYMAMVKSGVGRAVSDAGMEPLSQAMPECGAMDPTNRYDSEVPTRYLGDYLEYFEMEEGRFWETVERFRKPRLWTRKDGAWQLNEPGKEPVGIKGGAIPPPVFEPVRQTRHSLTL